MHRKAVCYGVSTQVPPFAKSHEMLPAVPPDTSATAVTGVDTSVGVEIEAHAATLGVGMTATFGSRIDAKATFE